MKQDTIQQKQVKSYTQVGIANTPNSAQGIRGYSAIKEEEYQKELQAEQGQKCTIIFCKKGKYQPRMDKEKQSS